MTSTRPTLVAEACALLAAGGAVVSGGTDLLARPDAPDLGRGLIDISGIAELRGIEVGDAEVRIGATATWTDVVTADLPSGFDGLRLAARSIGGPQIQNRATVGGNLCNASPAADSVPPLLALDAEVELASPSGVRRVPLGAFILGPGTTALRADEILTAVLMRRPAAGAYSGFVKVGRRRDVVVAVVSVAATIEWADDGRVASARVSVGAASAVPVRLRALESRLAGLPRAELARVGVAESDLDLLQPISDIRASADYRRHAAAVALRRLILDATEGSLP